MLYCKQTCRQAGVVERACEPALKVLRQDKALVASLSYSETVGKVDTPKPMTDIVPWRLRMGISTPQTSSMMVCATYNLSTQEGNAGTVQVSGQPESKVSDKQQ